MKVNIGKLTVDESVDLLKDLIDVLPEEDMMNALSEKLTMEQIDDLKDRLP